MISVIDIVAQWKQDLDCLTNKRTDEQMKAKHGNLSKSSGQRSCDLLQTDSPYSHFNRCFHKTGLCH